MSAKLNLSNASRDELVDLIRRQASKLKELQRTTQEYEARLLSTEQSIQLHKAELREEKASHSADVTALQDQVQQLSKALVEAHERLAEAEAARSNPAPVSLAPGVGGHVVDEAEMALLESRIARLTSRLAQRDERITALQQERDQMAVRLGEAEREVALSGGRVRQRQLEEERRDLAKQLEEKCDALQLQERLCVELEERCASLSQQLAAMEASAECAPSPMVGWRGLTVGTSKKKSTPNLSEGRSLMPTRSSSSTAIVRLVSSSSGSESRSSRSSSSSNVMEDTNGTNGRRIRAKSRTTNGRTGRRSDDSDVAPLAIPQQAHVIGLDTPSAGGGTLTAGTALFATPGTRQVAGLKRQIAELQTELRRREEAAASRAREEAAQRLELVENLQALQVQLDEKRMLRRVADAECQADFDAATKARIAELGVTREMLLRQAEMVRRLVALQTECSRLFDRDDGGA